MDGRGYRRGDRGVRSSVFGARLFPLALPGREQLPGVGVRRSAGRPVAVRCSGRSTSRARALSALVIFHKSVSSFIIYHNRLYFELSHTCGMQAAATDFHFAPKCSERRGERGGALLNSAVGGVV